jgi:hypothetical protein
MQGQMWVTKIDVYDSGEDSGMDRYTIVLDNEHVFGMSAKPKWGVNMYCGSMSFNRYNVKNFGRRITFSSLPEDVKQAVYERVWSD